MDLNKMSRPPHGGTTSVNNGGRIRGEQRATRNPFLAPAPARTGEEERKAHELRGSVVLHHSATKETRIVPRLHPSRYRGL